MHEKRLWGVLEALGRVAAAIALAVLGSAATAQAGDCGDGVAPCKCGDTVVTNTMLTGNIGVCQNTGLEMRSNVVLDCAGRSITGAGQAPAWYGIHLDPASNTEIKNCVVTGFRRGIRIGGGVNNRIINNESFANWKYGIEIAGGGTGNLIQGNRVGKPSGSGVVRAEEGIHNGSGSHNTVIRENIVTDSKDENIYILGSNGVQVIQNTVSEAESAGIFLKNSQGAYVGQNTVINGSITVRGDSSGNTLEGNTITNGRGYLFEAHQDETDDPSPGYWRYPRRNKVVGGRVQSPITIPNTDIKPCLRFEGSYKNQIEGLQLDAICTPPSQTPDGGQESVGNVINTIPLQ